MTREEKVALLQAKGAAMIAWFDGKPLPKPPVKLKPWATIVDADKYFSTQVARMNANHVNPFNRSYVLAYLALQELKTFMEADQAAETSKSLQDGKQ